jgi:acetyl-CoA carboxylase biotin carboxyl carrier protein
MEWDSKKIEELAMILEKYNLTEIEVNQENFRIALKKETSAERGYNNNSLSLVDNKSKAITDFQSITAKKVQQDELERLQNENRVDGVNRSHLDMNLGDIQKYVISPVAGIFYRQSQPGNPPYVEVGSRVRKGDIVCIVEAMKMINEIAADRDGVVVDFLVENEQFVEFGSPLLLIEEG